MNKEPKKPKRYFLELKIGGFFLLALILFFVALMFIREEKGLFKGSYILKIKFFFVEGLRPASPVRFCGVDVGEVKMVEVKREEGKSVVYVYAKINADVRIPKNSSFIINSLSLFGEKYLEIISPQKIDGYLEKNQVAEGISPLPLFTVMANFHKTMDELKSFMREGKLKSSLENILANTEAITLNINKILEDLRNKEGSLGMLLYDTSLYKKTEELIEEIKLHPWKLFYKPRQERKR